VREVVESEETMLMLPLAVAEGEFGLLLMEMLSIQSSEE
jgi:hypothetical protein